VGPGLRAVGEAAGRLDHDRDAQVLPRELGRVLLGGDGDGLAVDDERLVAGLDRAAELAVDRVVLEEVRERLRVGEVVDGDDLQVLGAALRDGAHDAASDTSESVDRDASGHWDLLRPSADVDRAPRRSQKNPRPSTAPDTRRAFVEDSR
jgi:hypothetical protein